jgi:hypothetical protein
MNFTSQIVPAAVRLARCASRCFIVFLTGRAGRRAGFFFS